MDLIKAKKVLSLQFSHASQGNLMLSRPVYALFVKKVVRKRFVMNLHGLKIKQCKIAMVSIKVCLRHLWENNDNGVGLNNIKRLGFAI